MAGHGAGVAETQIDVVVAVNVGEVRAVSRLDEDGKRPGPFFHPVHRHTAKQRVLCTMVESGGLRMVADEPIVFTFVQAAELFSVDSRHGFIEKQFSRSGACLNLDGAEPGFDSLGPDGDWEPDATHTVAVSEWCRSRQENSAGNRARRSGRSAEWRDRALVATRPSWRRELWG